MQNYDFDFQLDDFMLYCRTNQLRPKTMASYEQSIIERYYISFFVPTT